MIDLSVQKKSNTPSPPQLKQVLLYLWTVVGVSVHVVAVLEITCTWKYWIFDSLSGYKWQWRSLLLSMRWRIAINYITEHQIQKSYWPSFKMQRFVDKCAEASRITLRCNEKLLKRFLLTSETLEN